MARTGLRMMPTFPSSPLRFRTVSFPQYGSKASLSGSTFLGCLAVKPAPGMPAPRSSLCCPSPASTTAPVTGPESSPARASTDRCSRGSAALALPLCPRGPWLRSELCCLGPSPLTTTPGASLAGTRRLHSLAAYTPRLRGAGAPRRPPRPALLSQPSCPRVPSTLRRRSAAPSRCVGAAMPGFLLVLRSRHHQSPPLPAIPGGARNFGAASFASCCGPRVCLALLTGYNRVKSYAPHSAS